MSTFTRRTVLRSAAISSAAIVVSRHITSAQKASPAASAVSTEFPITVTTVNGTTEVPAAGDRVVALSYQDVDTVVALGVTPIGVQADVFSETGIPVWLEGQLDAADTTVLAINDEVPIEDVLQLEPDLILDTHGGNSAAIFDQLSGIAPTVSGLPEIQVDTITDRTRLVGALLGKADVAETVLADTNALIQAFAAEFTQLQGKTFTFGYTGSQDRIGVIISPDHFVVQLFSRFGLEVNPSLSDEEISANATAGGTVVSWEQAQLLDADVILLGFSTPELQEEFETSPLYANLTAAQRGNFLTITSIMATALNVPTVANIPWTLDQLRERFQQLDFVREA